MYQYGWISLAYVEQLDIRKYICNDSIYVMFKTGNANL